jgi:hypothetical protein
VLFLHTLGMCEVVASRLRACAAGNGRCAFGVKCACAELVLVYCALYSFIDYIFLIINILLCGFLNYFSNILVTSNTF